MARSIIDGERTGSKNPERIVQGLEVFNKVKVKCTCGCHKKGGMAIVHFVACCTGGYKYYYKKENPLTKSN